MGHIDRKMREKQALRNKILDAARAIGTAEGWASVTIRKIADEIEYTAPIVYEHFANKEAVFHAIMLEGFREVRASFDRIREVETDPKKILEEVAQVHLKMAIENKELYKLMYTMERPAPTEEMMDTMALIKEQFMILTNDDKELATELMLNWISLQTGVVTMVVKGLPPHLQHIDISIYLGRFARRFLDSI